MAALPGIVKARKISDAHYEACRVFEQPPTGKDPEMKFQMNSFKRLSVMTLAAWGTLLSPLAQGQGAGSDVYQAIVKREFGTASNEMAAIEQEIQDAKAEQYQKIEARLVSVLESPEATMPGKQFACQMLRIVGSAKCVPAISKLLVDDQLSHMARYVLQGMRDPLVDAALRKALGQTHGKPRLGVIDTLGDRGDRLSLEAVANMLKENDEATILCALNALGKIGGVHAADMLERAKRPGRFREAWAHAYLRTAGSVAAAGKVVRAEKIYQSLFDGDYPPVI